ncbi:SRX-2 protein, partial [Aphelenchoides avenae]
MPTLSRVLTGAALAVISGPMFLLNFSVLYVLVSERFYSKRYSSFYVLSTVNIIGDSIKTALVTFYLAPASITESWLFPGGPASPFSKVLAVFELLVWYQEIILEVFMALDRLVTVVFPDYSWIFSRKTIVVIACGIFPLATALTLIADFVMPCCT